MRFPTHPHTKKHLVHITYWLGFLGAAHGFLVLYINSSFLKTFTDERSVGILFALASSVAVLAFIAIPTVLNRFGNFKTLLVVLVLELIAMFGLALDLHFGWNIFFFIAHITFVRMIEFQTDIFLESGSTDDATGSIRGIFLTIINIALLISPFIAGLLLGETENYRLVYIAAGVVLVPTILFLLQGFHDFEDPHYHHEPLRKALSHAWHNQDIFKIIMSNFMLRFFFAWIVIYVPIYLNTVVGFSWSTLGLLFTAMLLPYVLLELPLGWLADTKYGEKEILSIGFVFIALSSIALSFIEGNNIWIWGIALFATRIGAAAVQVMSETYFFKKIDGTEADFLSFFRMTQPLAYIIAPPIAALTLTFIDMRYSFIVLGIIVLWGLRYSLTLRDTK